MFEKYQHVERIGTDETDGILKGKKIYVFPKIDGTNGTLWMENNQLCAGSRNRQIDLQQDNLGFYSWVLSKPNLKYLFEKNPMIRIFGEWLPTSHVIKNYLFDAWKKFYIFDILGENGKYWEYEKQVELIKFYNEMGYNENDEVRLIPPLAVYEGEVSMEEVIRQTDLNNYLMKEGIGEGIVIKNYDFVNKYGRTIWGKIVKIREEKIKNKNIPLTEEIEGKIIEKYVTKEFIEKEYSKIAVDGWSSKEIPKLLNMVFYNLIVEETWHILKEFKNPKIDFKRLQGLVFARVKEVKSELF